MQPHLKKLMELFSTRILIQITSGKLLLRKVLTCQLKVRLFLNFYLFIDQNEQQKTFVFCGDKKSGKSNLILKFLEIQMNEDVKETTALDFRFGNKKREE